MVYSRRETVDLEILEFRSDRCISAPINVLIQALAIIEGRSELVILYRLSRGRCPRVFMRNVTL